MICLAPKCINLARRLYCSNKCKDRHNFKILNCGIQTFVKLLKKRKCVYCGTKKELGFDRINNKEGHILKNVVIACETCNMTRGNRFTVKEMKKIGVIIASMKGGDDTNE